MATYTLVITDAKRHQHATLSDFPVDKTAIANTGEFLSADHPTATVTRGAGADVEFLSAWTGASSSRSGRPRIKPAVEADPRHKKAPSVERPRTLETTMDRGR